MTKQTYNQQTIGQYLLGSLPEAEAERLDQLSFTDDEFSAVLEAAEKDLVDAYVQGELRGTELEQFKSYYLASPLRREKVAFAQAFRGWSEKEGIHDATPIVPQKRGEKPKQARWFSGLSIFRTPQFALGLAAAALILLVAGGFLFYQNLHFRQQMTQAQARHKDLLQREQELQKEINDQRTLSTREQEELAQLRGERERLEQELEKARSGQSPQTVLSFMLAPPVRGSGQMPTITIRPGITVVSAKLQLEAADYSAYRVALIDLTNGQVLWHSGNVKSKTLGGRNAITVSVPSRLLKPQNYSLRVAGLSANGGSELISDYSFKVVK